MRTIYALLFLFTINHISGIILFDFVFFIKYSLQLHVPMIVADPLEELVRIQGCVGVTLAIQEHTAWMVSPCSQILTKVNNVIFYKYHVSRFFFLRRSQSFYCKNVSPELKFVTLLY